MTPEPTTYPGYRFPAEIISYAVWLYHVFGLSLRDVEFILSQPLVAAVGVELQQKREQAEQRAHQQHATVAVLDVGRVDDGVQQQALGVYQDMALLALDLLARIKAGRVDRDPPFSALLTLWLSMIAAVGLASRSANSRHCTYSA